MRRLWIVPAVVAVAVLALCSVAAAQAAGELKIESPQTQSGVTSGQSLTVSGRGCEGGSEVTVLINDRPLGTGQAAGDGTFAVPVTVPSVGSAGVEEASESTVAVECGELRASTVVAVSAGAQEERLTASLSPTRGPVGTEVTVSGEAPNECISIFVSTPPVGGGPSIIGDTDMSVTDGRYSEAFQVPQTDATGIVFELRCSVQGVLNLATDVTFDIVDGAAPGGPDVQDTPLDELPLTGPNRLVLIEAAIGFTMAAVGITMSRFARGLRARAG